MGSGGGTSGAVDFPVYIKETHHRYLHGTSVNSGTFVTLPRSLGDVMATALGEDGNPFSTIDYTDPAGDLADVELELSEYDTAVDALDPEQDWKDALERAFLDVPTKLKAMALSSIVTSSQSDTGTEFNTAKAANSVNFLETEEWPAFVDIVVAKLKECGVLKNVDVPSLFNVAIGQAGRAIEEAIRAVRQLMDDGVLDELVQSFEDSASYGKARSTRLFTGFMADVNAVHSSAFLMGLGLIEAQHRQDVNRFDRELRLEAFRSFIGQHGSVLGGVLQVAAGVGEAGQRLRGQVLVSGLQNIVQMLMGRKELETSLVQMHNRLFLGALETRVRGELYSKQIQDDAVMKNTSEIIRMQSAKLAAKQSLTQMMGEVKRLKFVSTGEYEGSIADLNEKDALWEFGVFERGANVLAAPSGMAAALPPKQSKASSVLSGAMGGASAGAALGPWGAAAGGVLGGLGGLLS